MHFFIAPGGAMSDVQSRCGWRAITGGSTATNWVAEYYNGSTFVPVHTNAAFSDQWHTLGIANRTGSDMTWFMDGVPVFTNSTPGQIAWATGSLAKIGERITLSPNGTNFMFWQDFEYVYEKTVPVSTGPL